MKIENEFVVAADVEDVWAYVLDVEKVAPCMPGAELTEVVDETTWKGKVAVKLGPVSMSFAGTVKLQERDDQAHRVVLKADGREQRGRGAASATVVATMHEVEGGTNVAFEQDLTITGAAAQYGRGMIQDITVRLTKEFADCLQANIGAEAEARTAGSLGGARSDEGAGADPVEGSSGAAEPRSDGPSAAMPTPAVQYATAKPVKGLRLGLWAFWRAIVRFFRRLFRRP